MLEVKELHKSFDGFQAVSGARLRVEKGQVVAVIGPNGAGKTTLFNLITGQLRPDSGRVGFQGEDITCLAPHLICRKGISRSYQVVNVFHRLTVFENVQIAVLSFQKKSFNLWAAARKMAVAETMAILESVGLTDKADQISGALSHGDQKVLEIAIALGNATAAADPRRTHGRHVARGNERQPGVVEASVRRSRPDHFVLRTRHGHGVFLCPRDHGHAAGPHHHSKHAGASAQHPRVQAAYLGGAQECSE